MTKKADRTKALLDMLGIAGIGLAIAILIFGLSLGPRFMLAGFGVLGLAALAITSFSIWRRRRLDRQ